MLAPSVQRGLQRQGAGTTAKYAVPSLSSNLLSRRVSSPSIQPFTTAGAQRSGPEVRVNATQSGGPARAGKKKVKKMVDITGDVLKDLSNGMFQVKLENGVSVIAHLSGKIRQNRIKVVVGDKVTVELSPYDLTKGRITLRHKPGQSVDMSAASPTASTDQ